MGPVGTFRNGCGVQPESIFGATGGSGNWAPRQPGPGTDICRLGLFRKAPSIGNAGAGMKRREFIRLLSGGMLAWPLAARAQPTGRVARVGFLGAASAAGYASRVEAFRSGLRVLGYVEGGNIIIEYRW